MEVLSLGQPPLRARKRATDLVFRPDRISTPGYHPGVFCVLRAQGEEASFSCGDKCSPFEGATNRTMKSSPLTLLLPGISQLTTALRGTFIQGFDSDNQDVRRGEGIDEFYVADGLFYGIDTVCRGQTFDTGDPMGLKAALTGVWDKGFYTVAALLTYTWDEADLLSNANGHWDRWSAGISVDRELWSRSRGGVSFE